MNLQHINRRRILTLGAAVAAGVVVNPLNVQATQDEPGGSNDDPSLWKAIEDIIQAHGMFSDGVFSIEIDRNDINNVTIHGVPIQPSFQVNGTLFFQKLDEETVMMNSDLALKGEELDPVIDQLLSHQIVFQAEHQHFYDFDPLVWFIHFRKQGDPLEIARGIKAALDVTSTPFPQTSPINPTTPLPADQIGQILGASPTIGSGGVVSYNVPREDSLRLGEVRINPYLNVATSIVFEPLGNGKTAAGAPDFGMIAREINPVVKLMRHQGWDIGCLYNQETDEYPQLYFSHQFKTGDPIQLAHEIRNGLNLMDVKFK